VILPVPERAPTPDGAFYDVSSIRGLGAVWLVWGSLPGEAPVHAVSERVAATGWIAPHQTRPMRHERTSKKHGGRILYPADGRLHALVVTAPAPASAPRNEKTRVCEGESSLAHARQDCPKV
jgi:hypothetical protein